MTRSLLPRERDVLALMIEHAENFTEGPCVSAQRRAQWLAQLPGTRAGDSCQCGVCPSIELVDGHGVTPSADRKRIVLAAKARGALLLLFIDDDRLSYLELAPISPDDHFERFPDPADITW